MQNEHSPSSIWIIIIVASLGYFVDIYDLVVFSIVRIESFKDIGILESEMRTQGQYVLNMQMGGLLIGGIIWGVIGDKFGRLKVLFGSILLYSIANTANGFVQDIHSYAIIRFIAGIGLAGELGAGVTLVSESMSKNKRGYGTMIIAGVGVLGAILAFYISEAFHWRAAYFAGGGMGLLLLILRLGTFESKMFQQSVKTQIKRGDLKMLLNNKERLSRFIYVLLIGLPIWFVVGVLVTQAPEFGKALGSTEVLSAGRGIMFTYIGISLGDIFAGLFAQVTKSRRLTVLLFQVMIIVSSVLYLSSNGITPERFVWLAFFMGFAVGYWATFVTIASEQFGTNLRSTVTTMAPNFVRGALIPSTFLFDYFVHDYGLINGAYIMIFILSGIAIFALSRLKESFNKDLNYLED
jgi:MFS family permease